MDEFENKLIEKKTKSLYNFKSFGYDFFIIFK